MKRKTDFLIVALFAIVLFTSCERVAPNYAGVLMENYGKQGKEDFKIVSGKVSTWELGTELFSSSAIRSAWRICRSCHTESSR